MPDRLLLLSSADDIADLVTMEETIETSFAPHHREVGGVLAASAATLRSGLTYYNTVGVGIQDAAVLELILERAHERRVGTTVPW